MTAEWSPLFALLTGSVATLVAVVPIIAFLWARAKRLEGMVPEWRRHAAGMIDDVGTSGTIRRRIRGAIAVLRGRPWELEVEFGEDHPVPEGHPHVVALRIPADSDEVLLSVGWGDWTWDGKPFPWATMGNVLLHAGDDQGTTVTVTIPVRLAGEAPEPVELMVRPDLYRQDEDTSGETCAMTDRPHAPAPTFVRVDLSGGRVEQYRNGTECHDCGAAAIYDPAAPDAIVGWLPESPHSLEVVPS